MSYEQDERTAIQQEGSRDASGRPTRIDTIQEIKDELLDVLKAYPLLHVKATCAEHRKWQARALSAIAKAEGRIER